MQAPHTKKRSREPRHLSNYLNHGWSASGDIGLGLNINWLFVEVKFAYMPQFVPNFGYGQNGFYYVPVTVGFNF